MELQVRSEVRGGWTVVAVSGELDADTVPVLSDRLEESTGANVVVDLSDVTYLDSAGLRILFTLAGRLRTLQTTLEVLVPVSSPVRRAVELSGLEPFVRLRDG